MYSNKSYQPLYWKNIARKACMPDLTGKMNTSRQLLLLPITGQIQRNTRVCRGTHITISRETKVRICRMKYENKSIAKVSRESVWPADHGKGQLVHLMLYLVVGYSIRWITKAQVYTNDQRYTCTQLVYVALHLPKTLTSAVWSVRCSVKYCLID